MAEVLRAADHIFYQSHFSKMSADLFLGEPTCSWEVLHNAVDTTKFVPVKERLPGNPIVLLLGGTQYHFDRVDTAFRTVAALRKRYIPVRLLVTGRLCWIDERQARCVAEQMINELDIHDAVEFVGFHNQVDAPIIYQNAHVLIHPKYNDPCPGTVIEALACGVPVVYSESGGVPELVGTEAGIGIPAECNWDTYIVPDPDAIAEGVLTIMSDYDRYSRLAREQAVQNFDLKPWIQRHDKVFAKIIDE